jgi:hypothetical protein
MNFTGLVYTQLTFRPSHSGSDTLLIGRPRNIFKVDKSELVSLPSTTNMNIVHGILHFVLNEETVKIAKASPNDLNIICLSEVRHLEYGPTLKPLHT